jgi:uncharacterized delta-60 repeat protein
MRSSLLLVGGSLAATCFAFACTGPDRLFIDPATGGSGGATTTSSGTAGEGGTGGQSSSLEISVPPDNVILREDSSVVVDVGVVRTGTTTDPTVITVGQLPTGVTADPLEIDAAATTGALTLHGAPGALQGVANVVVTANAGALQAMTSFDLVVAGAPGTPDKTFVDATGTYQAMIAGFGARGRGLLIQPDGKIVVTGISVFNQVQAFTLRLTALGANDAGFGSNGVVSTGIGGGSGGMTVAIDSNGRLIVGGFGEVDFEGNSKLALIALLPNGDLDAAGGFGAAGTVTSSNGNGGGVALAVFPTATDITAIGAFTDVLNNPHPIMYGYDLQGAQTSFFTQNDKTMQVAGRQPDGKLLLGGRSFNELFLTRFVDPSTTDPSFAGGTALVNFLDRPGIATGLAVLEGGQILLGGVTTNLGGTDPLLAFAKLNANGSLDISFGSGGTSLSNVPLSSRAANGMVRDSQGRFLFGGTFSGPDQKPAVARFLADGSPDPTFGPDGTGFVVLDQFAVAPDNLGVGVWGIAVDDLDRVVVSGEVGANGTPSLFVARYWF